MSEDVSDRIRRWVAVDPDPSTRAELEELARSEPDQAARRFRTRLGFGTAGLRGPLGAGPDHMNRVTVRTAAAAVARVLADRGVEGPVVIGHDARHGSAEFAADTARVMAGAGRPAHLLPALVPTPVLAYAVRATGAAAGIMVTASHNPPGDNGYKVYWSDGVQIVPPIDAEIASAIDKIDMLAPDALAPAEHPDLVHLGPGLVDDYLAATRAVARLSGAAGQLTIATTALHGVGGELLGRALTEAGFRPPVVVPEQQRPDPDFPTVSFPNPEEPGAMDRLLATARDVSADVAMANDPDADRLAVAVPDAGRWRVLSGNEVGWLLADHVLTHTSGTERLVSTSVVSSTLLDRLAAEHQVASRRTLTGFKWIARPEPGRRLVFGYEEALGYLVGDAVLDKDGIGAAVAMADLVAELAARGLTVTDALDDLARRFGAHLTDGWSIRFEGSEGAADMAAMMRGWRRHPPTHLADLPVGSVIDYAEGVGGLPPTDLVQIEAPGLRLMIRPSGTEPKVKFYAEAIEPVTGSEVEEARRRARARLDALATDVSHRS